jgi:hypothetical protein
MERVGRVEYASNGGPVWVWFAAAAAAEPELLCAWLEEAREATATRFASVTGPERIYEKTRPPDPRMPIETLYETTLRLAGATDCAIHLGGLEDRLVCMGADLDGEALDQRVGACLGDRRSLKAVMNPFTVWSTAWADTDPRAVAWIKVLQWHGHPASVTVTRYPKPPQELLPVPELPPVDEATSRRRRRPRSTGPSR